MFRSQVNGHDYAVSYLHSKVHTCITILFSLTLSDKRRVAITVMTFLLDCFCRLLPSPQHFLVFTVDFLSFKNFR